LDRAAYQKVLNKFGENRATETVRKHHTYMRACLRDAIEDGVIIRDPTYRAIVKGNVAPKDEEVKYLHFKDAKRLITEVKKDLRPQYISRYMILFGLASGCRFSEMMGLTWDCIDFNNKKVKINKTWDYTFTNDFSNTK